MSNRPAVKDNVFSVFIILAGLVVVGTVIMLNQAPQVRESDTILAHGGVGDIEEAEITAALNNINKVAPDEEAEEIAEVIAGDLVEPITFTINTSATVNDEGDITSYRFGEDDVINVMPLDFQDMVLNENSVIGEEEVVIDGVTGKRITISSAKDGSSVEIIHVEHGRQLFDIRGTEDFLDDIDQYVTFTN